MADPDDHDMFIKCRLCLKDQDSEAASIFDTPTHYADQIEDMLQVKLLETPGWPNYACSECVHLLEEMKRLKASILDAHCIFYESLQQVKTGKAMVKGAELMVVEPDQLSKEEGIESDDDVSSHHEKDDDYEGSESPSDSEDPVDVPASTSSGTAGTGTQHNPIKRQSKLEEEASLEEAMRTMDLLKCHGCQKSTNSLNELFAHFRNAHKNKRGYIFCCERKKIGRVTALDHIRVHLNENAFQCQQCWQRYPSKWSLAYHVKQAHTMPEERDFICEKCGQTFKQRVRFEQHMLYHLEPKDRKYPCQTCKLEFTTPFQLKRHVLSVHEQAKAFICEQCGRGYATATILSEHVYKKHRDKRSNPLQKGCKKLRCEKCGHWVSERNYQAHEANNCFVNGGKMICVICQRVLKTRKSLMSHMRTMHPDRTSMDCPHCSFTATTAGTRMRHIKNSHPEEFAKLAYTIKDDMDDPE